MNKLDVLSGVPEVPIATAYRIDGKLVHEFPMTLGELSRAEPVYEACPGWRGELSGVRRFEDLPDAARRYVDRVEALVGVPVELVSVGPGRDETIVRADPFRARAATSR
jgi:adenylosuccinate synthase